ncbi:MAG TPA: mechanosensitive ion channel domain-containing protein, partial [Spirochaetota bacterium]
IIEFVHTALKAYMIIVVITVVISVINAVHEIIATRPYGKNRSVVGYTQVVKAGVVMIGGLLILSLIMNRDVGSLLAGITAFAAVLMFIFKDLILGLVAGIQISANDIVRVGDYIEMKGRFAEGTIIDISLNMIKVLNTNRTISIIPSYAIVSEPFLNWRGLENSPGRRIKRSIIIDVRSVRSVENSFIDNLKRNGLNTLAESINNNTTGKNHLTNLGVYRHYVEECLKSDSRIDNNSTILVHHLPQTENGLPLEIIAYSIYRDGVEHELLMSDLFEQYISILSVFELRFFQRPTGEDVNR